MQKHIITLLCGIGLAISAPAHAQLKLRPDAPQRYVVKPGDTLWGISKQYLYSPWQWPSLWGFNRSQVRNPHLIYPGQVLVLRYVNGRPVLGLAQQGGIPTIKLSPRVREISSGYGISTLNIDAVKLFTNHLQVIPVQDTLNAPTIVSGPETRVLYAKGDRVYAYGIDKPGTYLSYRVNKYIRDPDTQKLLGQEVVFSGKLSTLAYTSSALANRSEQDAAELPANEHYTRLHPLVKVPTKAAQPMVVEEAVSEIRKGDYLFPMEDRKDNTFNFMPHAPAKRVEAKVVSIIDGINQSGALQTITFNKGLADGLDEGTVLSLYKKAKLVKPEREIKDGNSKTVIKYLTIPAEEVGLAMIYHASQDLSYALILESTTNISIGDIATEPGHDLDEMEAIHEHAPNVPQDPHAYDFNKYGPIEDTVKK